MPKVKMEVARARRACVLAALADRGAGREGAVLSLRAVAADAGLSCSQARSALRALKESGHVRSTPRSLPNGGTAENAYRVTPVGLEALGRTEPAGGPRGSGDAEGKG